MTSIFFSVGAVLILAGLFFAVSGRATSAAGGTATKGFSISGPSWLILVALGIGVIVFGTLHDDKVKEREFAHRPVAPLLATPVTDSGCITDINGNVACASTGAVPQDTVVADPAAFDPALDQLWSPCQDGDMQSCDDMYQGSPPASVYEDFAMTCGNRIDPQQGNCVGILGRNHA